MMSFFIEFSMFFLSFLPLWVSIIFIDIKSMYTECTAIYTEKFSIAIILIIIFISMLLLRFSLNVHHKKNNAQKYYLENVEEEKSISSEFLLSYVLPLFTFDFTKWDGIFLFLIFFFFLAFLCIKHHYFSVNIYLECMGYSFYRCELSNEDGIKVNKVILSRENLRVHNNEYILLRSLNNEYSLDLEDWFAGS